METSLKTGFAQISLSAQKISVAQNLGGQPLPPPRPVRLCWKDAYIVNKLTLYKIIYGHENRQPWSQKLWDLSSCNPYLLDICSVWFCCSGNTGRRFVWYIVCFEGPVAENRCPQAWCLNLHKELSCWWCDSGGLKPKNKRCKNISQVFFFFSFFFWMH